MMKRPLQATTLAVLALLCLGASAQLIANRDHYCSGIALDSYALSDADLRAGRDHAWNPFYSDYDNFFDWVRDQTSTNYIAMYRWQFGLYLTLVLLLVVSLIIFLVNLCLRRAYAWTWAHHCLWPLILFFLIWLGLFITQIVFLSITQHRAKRAYCAIHSLPTTLLYGNAGAANRHEFIGYQPLIFLIKNYTAEVGNLAGVIPQAEQIIAAQLPARTRSLLQNHAAAWNSLNQTVVAPAGSVLSDFVVREPRAGPLSIQREFSDLDTLANDLYVTATEARFLGSGWYASDARNSLDSMRIQLEQSVTRFDRMGNEFVQKAMRIQGYVIGGMWTMFGLGVAFTILALWAIITFCCLRRGSCLGCLRWMKWLLILLTVLAILYGIATLVLMAGVAGSAKFCRWAAEVNQGGWAATNAFEQMFLDNTTSINSTNPGYLLKGCFFRNSTGYIPSLFNTTSYVTNSYDRLINLVHGLTVYRNYVRTYGNFGNTASPALARYRLFLAQVRNGDYLTNSGAYLANSNLNRIASCDGKQFGFTQNACTNYFWANCGPFGAGWAAPQCSSDAATANTAFANIASHVASNAAAVDAVVNALAPIDTQYGQVVAAFAAQRANVEAIQTVLKGTLESVSGYNNTLKQITNCGNLQVELTQFERYACFPFVRPAYILLVLALVATFFLLPLLWALWCLLHHRKPEPVVVVAPAAVTQTVVSREQFLAVSEQELIPKY